MKKTRYYKHTVDVLLTALLLCLMSYQVTGEALHEWCGVAMSAAMIVHHVLNRKWYGALFRGKYPALRAVMTAVNMLLLLSIALAAFSGMAMSGHAVPFLYGMAEVSFARLAHLCANQWSFLLMGLHLGLHLPPMTAKMNRKTRAALGAVFVLAAAAGLWLFMRSGIVDYLFLRTRYAFLDYGKAAGLVFLENLLMLLFWAFWGACLALALRRRKKTEGKA